MLFKRSPDIAALTYVQETEVLQQFLGGSTVQHLPTICADDRRLDLYVCAKSTQRSSWVGVAVLGKDCFLPLRPPSLCFAKETLGKVFPRMSQALVLAQMISPRRLSLIEIADIEPRVTASEERQFEFLDPDEAYLAA
jgi:hypothetical protein